MIKCKLSAGDLLASDDVSVFAGGRHREIALEARCMRGLGFGGFHGEIRRYLIEYGIAKNVNKYTKSLLNFIAKFKSLKNI